MPLLYVARSPSLSRWGGDVGLGRNIFKLGVAADLKAAKADLAAGVAGQTDWTILASEAAEAPDEAAIVAKVAGKERLVDPRLYPGIKGAGGIFRVKPENAENHILVSRALANQAELEPGKLKPSDIARYLLHNALR